MVIAPPTSYGVDIHSDLLPSGGPGFGLAGSLVWRCKAVQSRSWSGLLPLDCSMVGRTTATGLVGGYFNHLT